MLHAFLDCELKMLRKASRVLLAQNGAKYVSGGFGMATVPNIFISPKLNETRWNLVISSIISCRCYVACVVRFWARNGAKYVPDVASSKRSKTRPLSLWWCNFSCYLLSQQNFENLIISSIMSCRCYIPRVVRFWAKTRCKTHPGCC